MSQSKILVVVESGAKAKTIQKYLGSDYIIRETKGHLFDLASFGYKGLGIDIINDFKTKYELIPDKKDKLEAIVSAAKGCDRIYLASDPDREGEAIAWHLAEYLENLGKPISRVLFHEITKKALIKSVENPIDLNKNLFDAQQARRVLDRLVGFLVSPYLHKTLGGNLSAGRVQSVAVRLIVDREREIENFVPEEYWNILAKFSNSLKKEFFFAKYVGKITNQEEADKIKKDLENSTFVISNIVREEQKKPAPPPFTTSTLQQVASKTLGMSAQNTMKAAQSLYEAGIVTYIRTDSVRSSPESIESLRNYLKVNNFDIPEQPNVFKVKDNAQDAHEAIRPTDVEKTPSKVFVSDDEQRVYSLIWERFVSSQLSPAVYDVTTIHVKSSTGHDLKAQGKVLKSKGWLILNVDKDEEASDEGLLPNYPENEELQLIAPKLKIEKKSTKPPSRYKEHSLTKELEHRGIGRPATYAAIMQKVTDRKYVEKRKDTFYPTELGKTVSDKLCEFFNFVEYKYTAKMEEQLDLIAEGKLQYLDMMRDFYSTFKTQLKTAYLHNEKDYGFKCESCNSRMLLRRNQFGLYFSCINFPQCKIIKSCDPSDGNFIPVDIGANLKEEASCPKCMSPMLVKYGKFGRFYSCCMYPKCNGTSRFPIEGKICKKCGKGMCEYAKEDKDILMCLDSPNCDYKEDLPFGTIKRYNLIKKEINISGKDRRKIP